MTIVFCILTNICSYVMIVRTNVRKRCLGYKITIHNYGVRLKYINCHAL